MVSASPPDPALTAAANGASSTATAAAGSQEVEQEEQEQEEDVGAQRIAAYKKLGLGACTVTELEVSSEHFHLGFSTINLTIIIIVRRSTPI